jgi:ubiquinone/menaquinone biosynthesis C-methylase UbiE
MTDQVVLHVGCGSKDIRTLPKPFHQGWREVRLDIDPAARPDVIGTMTDMQAVDTASVDAIFSSHNVEHLYPHEVPTALKEFRRVLKSHGFALITCPDLQAVAQLIVDGGLLRPAYHSPAGPITPLDMLYGHRGSISRGNLYMAHHGGFTMETLIQALREAGFRTVAGRRRPRNYDLWALAHVSGDQEPVRAMAASYFPT